VRTSPTDFHIKLIVAIDGPAGSGKSTTARALAERLGFLYLDTGAMYRAVALLFIETETEVTAEAADRLLASADLQVNTSGGGMAILLNGKDVSSRIRSREVTQFSSVVSSLPAVRLRMVEEQRFIAHRESRKGRGVVMEGRDIGTVVFPDADVKIYLDADRSERARRRLAEMEKTGKRMDVRAIEAEMVERDERDRTRAISPLRIADDAIVVDTTDMTLDEQVNRIAAIIREQTSNPTIKK